jgi:2,3-bisphosphoglycerate-dependent phosphoglycerate mutase
MKTTLYFIRHAQCSPSPNIHHSQWPLSETGKIQARRLTALLHSLEIQKLFSSPFDRCLETIDHFKVEANLDVAVNEDLRERLIENGISHMESPAIWKKSWEDFNFAIPECESSLEAQARFVAAVKRIVETHHGMTIGISSHGNVIALFLNHLDPSFKREHAERIRNPDVIKLTFEENSFVWHSQFVLSGIDDIATHHSETKIQAKQ